MLKQVTFCFMQLFEPRIHDQFMEPYNSESMSDIIQSSDFAIMHIYDHAIIYKALQVLFLK